MFYISDAVNQKDSYHRVHRGWNTSKDIIKVLKVSQKKKKKKINKCQLEL